MTPQLHPIHPAYQFEAFNANGWKIPPDFSNDWKNISPLFQ